MIIEHAVLSVTPGRESEFETAMLTALPIIESAPDCYGAEVRRQEEDRTTYLLIVRWSSVAAHVAFRETALFEQWRAQTHPFYARSAIVTHFAAPIAR